MFLRKLCVIVLPLVMAALLCLVLPLLAGMPFWTEVFQGLLMGVMLALVFMAALMDMAAWLRVLLIVVGVVTGITGALLALRIEQSAGYYHCEKCGHKYVPTYRSVLWAMHVQRTRYMRCPECGKCSWQKKVLTKD